MKLNPYKTLSFYTAVMGVMLGAAVMLTILESQLSSFLPAGIRLGLSNVVIMTAVTAVNIPSAFILTALKSLFVLLTRGVTAGAMSLCGGIFAFTVTILIFRLTGSSYILMSVLAAIAHITGQLLLACVITKSIYTLYYIPVYLGASAATGICTGLVLNAVLKHIKILHINSDIR